MKKSIILLLFVVLGFISSFAQEHISFMGIPVDGPASAFVTKLKAKGFTLDKSDDKAYLMSGSFTGKDVELFVFFSPKTKVACKVVVYYPKRTSWYSIKGEYNNLKESYEKKYHLRNSFSFFSDPYYEGDGYEMQAVRNEKCNYISFFDAPGGGIVVEISEFEQVKVAYEDDANMEKSRKERENAVMDEI